MFKKSLFFVLLFGILLLGLIGTNAGQKSNFADENEFSGAVPAYSLQEIKYLCDGVSLCNTHFAVKYAVHDYDKAKTICDLNPKPENTYCNLKILALHDVNILKEECANFEDYGDKDTCYRIAASETSKTDPDAAISICENDGILIESACYNLVASKHLIPGSIQTYEKSIEICNKISWPDLKQNCLENINLSFHENDAVFHTKNINPYNTENIDFMSIEAIKKRCDNESISRDGCYIGFAKEAASINHTYANSLCSLASESRHMDCTLGVLAIFDVDLLKKECAGIENRALNDLCYSIAAPQLSKTNPEEAIEFCSGALNADLCYYALVNKIDRKTLDVDYRISLTACNKIKWSDLKESCIENIFLESLSLY